MSSTTLLTPPRPCLAGRPLEHEHLTGAMVAAADRRGIPVPVNRTVLALLRGLDASLAAS